MIYAICSRADFTLPTIPASLLELDGAVGFSFEPRVPIGAWEALRVSLSISG
jgi:hypothetical protein